MLMGKKGRISKLDKTRVLYHVGHYGYFPKMLLHKLHYHTNSDAIFLLTMRKGPTYTFMEKWNETNSDLGLVFLYSDGTDKIFRKKSNIVSLEQEIRYYFEELFQKIGTRLEDFDVVYSGFDWYHAFGAYLSISGKEYMLFDMDNVILDRSMLYDLSRHPDSQMTYWEILKKHKSLDPYSKYV